MGPALTIGELVAAGRARLPAPVRDYLEGGAEDEVTLRRNRAAFRAIGLLPRVLCDVSAVDLSAELFGQRLALPVLTAPIGSVGLLDPGGALAVARGAAAAGTVSVAGLLSQPSLEEVARGAGRPQLLQLYIRGGRDWLDGVVGRVEDAGYAALVLTVDSAVYGRRERDLRNRYSTVAAADRANLGGRVDSQLAPDQARLTWADLDWLRRRTRLPLLLKGIARAEDAARAVEAGADGVWVSNHGGRQLDGTPAAVELLPAIVAAVGGRVPVGLDGGIRRGTDVLKALALGARFVAVGRLMGWALAADGEAGVRRLLDLLAEEMRTALALLGHRSLATLGAGDLVPLPPLADLPTDPPETVA